jgi:hypothetical protein
MSGPEFFPDDALPIHYDADGQVCSRAGGRPAPLGGCPDGCDFAPHYSNDGHRSCYDPPELDRRGVSA